MISVASHLLSSRMLCASCPVKTSASNRITPENPSEPSDTSEVWNLKRHSFRRKKTQLHVLQWSCKSSGAAGRQLPLRCLSISFRSNCSNSRSLSVCVLSAQAENSALSMENDNQRKQYERCLDEVSVNAHARSNVSLCQGKNMSSSPRWSLTQTHLSFILCWKWSVLVVCHAELTPSKNIPAVMRSS